MKKILWLMLCLCLLAAPATARKKNDAKAAAAGAQPASKTQKGLFTVSKSGTDWFFEVPDSLIGRKFLVTVRYTSTPGGTQKYGGELVNQQTVYWQVAPDNKLMLRSELLINTADSTDAINKAIMVSNENPIIGAFKIESHKKGMYKIKVTQFFNEDNPAIGLRASTKTQMGCQALLSALSYIVDIKTFPLNTEIRTVKTWMSSRGTIAAAYTGKVTIGLNISFILLPKVPMQRRLFDPRVGYFTDQFVEFSDNQQRVKGKRFITRWRLEPKDSADLEKMKRGELVEPKKPIVYYIDPATPKQWRPYLIQGVNDWQKAFEKAGFKNAIMAKEWPENDSTMSMEDARYSVIRYLASDIPNAYGPHVHDPRSGEILESHICWYHNVMELVHDWYMIQAGTLDEAAQKMKFDTDLMGQLIRFVSSHEVGHTLGLRHNFGSSSLVPVDSLRSKSFVEKYGHTPSIMDYARFNYVAQPEDGISRAGIFPRIGDYDIWAIEWGHKPMFNAFDDESDHYELEALTSKRLAENPRLWFGDGETNLTNDSRCQTEDLGDNAMKAGEYGILNLKRIVKKLPEWTYERNDIHGQNLDDMYSQVVTQFMRYVYHVEENIGGVYADYKTVDQPGAVYSNAPRSKQKEAFAFLDRHIFDEPTWLIAEDYMLRLTPTPESYTRSLGTSVMRNLVRYYKLETLTPEYPVAEYLSDITNALFGGARGAKPTAYVRNLQTIFVHTLCSNFNLGLQLQTSKSHAATLATLKDLKKRLATMGGDAETRAHYAALVDHIDRTLVIK